jgi:methionine-gamma-lyase
MVRRIAATIGKAQGHTPIVACDNTLLGPCFSVPSNTAQIFRYTP